MKGLWVWSSLLCGLVMVIASSKVHGGTPYRVLLDTDVDTDDFFALLYLLKLNRSQIDLQVLSLTCLSILCFPCFSREFDPISVFMCL